MFHGPDKGSGILIVTPLDETPVVLRGLNTLPGSQAALGSQATVKSAKNWAHRVDEEQEMQAPAGAT